MNMFKFPYVFKATIKKEDIEANEFVVCRDIYKLYIEQHSSARFKDILRRWQKGEVLVNDDYKYIIEGSFSNVRNNNLVNNSENDILGKLGVKLSLERGVQVFSLKSEDIDTIKSEVYDYVFLNIFNEGIELVLEDCFSGGRNLGVYRSAGDMKEYKIDLACRAAYKFTQYNFLFNQNDDVEFVDYFIDAFHKRIRFVKLISEQIADYNQIQYLPIYENFSNYDNHNNVNCTIWWHVNRTVWWNVYSSMWRNVHFVYKCV